ncbi:MAG: hypothetical protein AAB393_12275 [Bacteroidota bacterium]|mgnify:CR=1 FL=1
MIKPIAVVALFAFALVGSALGQTTKKESTIIGDVVDIKSYVAYGMKADNPDRKATAEASMKTGNPLGIVEKGTGKIYVVVMAQQNENANEKLKDYLGLHVYVKGLVHKKGGVQLLIMSDIGKSIK